MLLAAAIVLQGCAPRIALSEDGLPVVPRYDREFADTVVVGTITMLSNKMQALDIVELRGDTACRVARVLLEQSILPYHGGVVRARLRLTQTGVLGYMVRAEVLEWTEEPLERGATRKAVEETLKQQHRRLKRLLRKSGFEGWEPDGTLELEGYDPRTRTAIYSMRGGTVVEGNLEREPILVVWADAHGEILRVRLAVINRVLERRR